MNNVNQTGCVYWVHRITDTNVKSQGYIGVTTKLLKRKRSHLSEAKLGTHINKHFANALLKYDDIVWEILFSGPIEGCYQIENYFRPFRLIGWNLIEGGGQSPNTGATHSPETREKISKKVKDYFKDNQVARNNLRLLRLGKSPFAGKTHTEKSKEKISNKLTQFYANNPDKLMQLQQRSKNSPSMKGKSHSADTKEKMSKSAHKRRAVRCIETDVVYPGVTEAYKAMGLKTHTPLAKAARDGSMSAGYHWRYEDAINA